jgi:UDP-glucose 4-epimerase
VNDSIRWICDELGLKPKIRYSGGDRGWVGDNPFIYLDTKKIRSTGWQPVLSIEQAVRATVRWFQEKGF